jgi:two-component system nitrogen regulation sensor histidine kinase GlnL
VPLANLRLIYSHAPNDEFNTEEALLNTLNSGQHYTRREAIIKVNFKDIHVDYTVSQLNSNKPYHPLAFN